MTFKPAARVELDKFFEGGSTNTTRDQIFEFEYALIASRLIDELKVLDENISRSDKNESHNVTLKPRVDLIEIIKKISHDYFYFTSSFYFLSSNEDMLDPSNKDELDKIDLPTENLKKFTRGLVDVSLSLIQVERPGFFAKKSTRILASISAIFKKNGRGDNRRHHQHISAIHDGVSLISSEGFKAFTGQVSKIEDEGSDNRFQALGRLLVSFKYTIWEHQERSELLYMGYYQLVKLLGTEKAQSLIWSLIDRLRASGYHLPDNTDSWLNRAKSRKYKPPKNTKKPFELFDMKK